MSFGLDVTTQYKENGRSESFVHVKTVKENGTDDRFVHCLVTTFSLTKPIESCNLVITSKNYNSFFRYHVYLHTDGSIKCLRIGLYTNYTIVEFGDFGTRRVCSILYVRIKRYFLSNVDFSLNKTLKCTIVFRNYNSPFWYLRNLSIVLLKFYLSHKNT